MTRLTANGGAPVGRYPPNQMPLSTSALTNIGRRRHRQRRRCIAATSAVVVNTLLYLFINYLYYYYYCFSGTCVRCGGFVDFVTKKKMLQCQQRFTLISEKT